MSTPIPQSAVLPYRFDKKRKLQFALITSKTNQRWIIPKGLIEDNMTPWASAAKEALEEAGLLGKVGERPLGRFTYEKWDRTYRVEIYPFRVIETLDDWDEKNFRKREWLTAKDAMKRLDEPAVKKVIGQLLKLKKWPRHLP